jgi:hypothetical protein
MDQIVLASELERGPGHANIDAESRTEWPAKNSAKPMSLLLSQPNKTFAMEFL